MSNFLPRSSRRPRFAFHLHIHDLNNVPLVSGSSFIKWHLPASNAAEHRGRTPKAQIRDHRVVYDYERDLTVRLSVGKDGVLQPVEVVLEVVQEYSSSGRGERIVLGRVRVNLAEYVGVGEEGNGGQQRQQGGQDGDGENSGDGFGVTRRYLMQESKINSTLKIGLAMRHIEGTREYFAPPLKAAQVFGGIAGIVSSGEPAGGGGHSHSQGEDGGAGAGNGAQGAMDSMPSLGNRKGELEMQDMYRRTLAAYWSSQPGEMKADECIEDIFGGGDGWGQGGRPQVGKEQQTGSGGSEASTPRVGRDVGEAHRSHRHHHHHHHHHHHRHRTSWRSPMIQKDGVNARGSAEREPLGYRRKGDGDTNKSAPGEVNEFDVREDLRSWRIGVPAKT